MKTAFKALVPPQYKELSKALGVAEVSMEDNHTVIPVRVIHQSGTAQIIEDGIVTECNHAGATLGDVDLGNLFYNPASGTVEEYNNTHRGLICDKCPAWQDESGEWHE